MSTPTTVNTMDLHGGSPCLDFINSGLNTAANVLVERLHSYDDLLTLSGRLGLLPDNEIAHLRKTASKRHDESLAELAQARKVRWLMYRLFLSIVEGTASRADELFADFHRYEVEAFGRERLVVVNGMITAASESPADLRSPLMSFIRSASRLLRSPDQRLLKKCAGCAWLFLDGSKNHQRKWCDMQTCGSAEKSKRYYRKKIIARKANA